MPNENTIIQLQRDALNPSIDTISLLRKAYAISYKLNLNDFKQWIQNELYGYPETTTKLPKYRQVPGNIKAWLPVYDKWELVLSTDTELINTIQNDSLYASISSLQALFEQDKSIYFPFSQELNNLLSQSWHCNTKFAFFVDKNIIQTILEIVKTHVLDWSLTLEYNGILGEGLVFTENEKKIAVNSPVINNYTNNFFESITNTQIQQGTNESIQNK